MAKQSKRVYLQGIRVFVYRTLNEQQFLLAMEINEFAYIPLINYSRHCKITLQYTL